MYKCISEKICQEMWCMSVECMSGLIFLLFSGSSCDSSDLTVYHLPKLSRHTFHPMRKCIPRVTLMRNAMNSAALNLIRIPGPQGPQSQSSLSSWGRMQRGRGLITRETLPNKLTPQLWTPLTIHIARPPLHYALTAGSHRSQRTCLVPAGTILAGRTIKPNGPGWRTYSSAWLEHLLCL